MDPAYQSGYIIGMIIGIGVVLGIWLLIGSLIFKAACWICREEQPSFGSAMAIVFVSILAQVVFALAARFLIAPLVGATEPTVSLVVAGLNICIGGAVISAMLPTGLLKGILISFLQLLLPLLLCLTPALLLPALRQGMAPPASPRPNVSRPEAVDFADDSPTADQEFLAEALREFKSLEGPRKAEAIAPNPAVGRRPRPDPGISPRPASGEPIDVLIAELGDPENHKIRHGADGLAKLPVDESRRAEVRDRLVAVLAHHDDFVRWAASNGLKTWADAEAVPALLTAIDDSSFVVRQNAIETLGRLQDPRAAGPLVAHLKSDKIHAKEALKKLGPAAEPAVLTALNDDDWTVRSDACQILKEIGTGLSVADLKKHILHDQNGIVRMNAQAALKQIGPDAKPPEAAPTPKAAPAPPKKKRRL